MVKIFKPTEEVLTKAANIIKKGGLVVFPTETVYGLGVDALNKRAVSKVFEVKRRPYFDPIIVHIHKVEQLEKLTQRVDKRVKLLTQKFWPGPLTIVVPKSDIVPYIVTAGLDTVAIRMPSHPVALELIQKSHTPIAAPSANLFGSLSPTSAQHVVKQLGEKVDLIIDGGKCPIGIESTVITLEPTPTILRQGGIPLEEIEPIIGGVKLKQTNSLPQSPGQLPHHYSPNTPLKIYKKETFTPPKNLKAGLLAFKSHPPHSHYFKMVEILSPSGELSEAGANFFHALHKLDEAGLDIIYVEPVPEKGLGRAIMERIRKAEKR